jgi:hypothetical protein
VKKLGVAVGEGIRGTPRRWELLKVEAAPQDALLQAPSPGPADR